jgi:hypothetical protein
MFNNEGFRSDLTEIPQFKRGKVWCTQCGREERADAVSATTGGGWPKCCGYTMTIDSPEERASRDHFN